MREPPRKGFKVCEIFPQAQLCSYHNEFRAHQKSFSILLSTFYQIWNLNQKINLCLCTLFVLCACLHLCLHVCIFTFIYIYTYIYICIYVCIHIYIYVHIFLFKFISLFIFIFTFYVYICICIRCYILYLCVNK